MLTVFCTTNSLDNAKKIAHALVEERISACVNIVPKITSVYRWKNKIESESEYLLIIKTHESLFERLKTCVQEYHPYEVPELIGFEITKGSDKYLSWLRDNMG